MAWGDNDRRYRYEELISGVCCGAEKVNVKTLEHVLTLSIEIAREGREGKKIGTMFVVSDSDKVLNCSRCLILDPLYGHPDYKKLIENPDMRSTVKELAQLDGAFVVSDSGIVISATRYINATSDGIDLPLGLGSRHMAGASITKHTDAVTVVVSESSIVRVFDDGEIISEIIPELWMLKHYRLHIEEPYTEQTGEQLTVLTKEDR